MLNWIERLNFSLNYIENHLCDEICFDEISRIVVCPTETLKRFFVLNTGITLNEYIRRRRMHEAFLEFSNTNINIKVIDIAMKYGYNSSDAFTSAFKRIHGMSPSMARRGKKDTFNPFLRIHISLTISYMGDETMENGISNENVTNSIKNNWYKCFYDDTYGWS
jgi:AraC family transcriptional regulator